MQRIDLRQPLAHESHIMTGIPDVIATTSEKQAGYDKKDIGKISKC